VRLKSEIWVKAYLRRCAVAGASGVVVQHGDDDAGAIYIKIVRPDGMATVFTPAPAGWDGADVDRRWVPYYAEGFVAEATAQAYLEREARFDNDVWVIEIEDREGRDFLGDDLLAGGV
jgi:hypothetical protein